MNTNIHAFRLPVDFSKSPETAVLSHLVLERLKVVSDADSARMQVACSRRFVELSVVRFWSAWARSGTTLRSMKPDERGMLNFYRMDWAVVLWAEVETFGLWPNLTEMCYDLLEAKVLVRMPDDMVTLAGYAALNENLDPLYVERSRKGGLLRHWTGKRKGTREDAARRMEVARVADMPLPFPSDAQPTDAEQRMALELYFGVRAAMDQEMNDPSAAELAAALHLVRTLTGDVIEAGLRNIAANRIRPDIASRSTLEILEGFQSLAELLCGGSSEGVQ